MVDCKFCGEDAGYMPFKCSYCGEKYCKLHRLPENHRCNMKNAEKIIEQKTKGPEKVRPVRRYSTSAPYESTMRPSRSFASNNFIDKIRGLSGVATIIIIEIIFLVLSLAGLWPYLLVSLGGIIQQPWLIYTIITAMFVPATGLSGFGFISLFIHYIFLFMIGRGLEGRYGKRRFMLIYYSGTLITSISIILLQLLFSFSSIYDFTMFYSFFAVGGGQMAYMMFWAMLSPNQVITLYLYFIPVRLKLKHVLMIFIGFELIPGIISLVYATQGFQDPSFIMNFANLFGLLGGYWNLQKVGHEPMGVRRF